MKQDHPTPSLHIGFLCAMESSPLTLHWKMALIFAKEVPDYQLHIDELKWNGIAANFDGEIHVASQR
jgi:hypothetical protein